MPGEYTLPTTGFTGGVQFGRGFTRYLSVAAPPAGQSAVYSLSQGEWQRLISWAVTLTTSATVINRGLSLSVVDGDGNTVIEWGDPNVQAASTAKAYYFGINYAVNGLNVDGSHINPVSDYLAQPGFTIQARVFNLQPGDQLSQSLITVEAYPAGHLGYPTGQNYLPEG